MWGKGLKKLQDNLGDYHDLAVHQEMLEKFKEQLITNRSGEEEAIFTIVILVQKLLKQDFIESFHIYSAPEIQTIFQDLLDDSIVLD